MNKELHLNKEQLAELKEMGPLAEEAAYGLQLWRDADPWPWEIDSTDKGYVNGERSGDSGPYLLLHPGDMAQFDNENAEAIVYARNTAELRATLTYHNEKISIHDADTVHAFLEGNDRPILELYAHHVAAIEAIVQALKKMRNE